MANKAAIECTDQLLRSLMDVPLPFGGKVFLALGDFRQVAPVRGATGPSAAFQSSIRSLYLWQHFQVLPLKIPVRIASDPEYSDWIDSTGEGYEQHPHLRLLQRVQTVPNAIDFCFPIISCKIPTQLFGGPFLVL